MDEKLTRIIETQPAFDRRDPDPKKNYGIHCLTFRFLVKGERGAVQFVLYTGWQLPHVRREYEEKARAEDDRSYGAFLVSSAMPADLGYHSYVPMYEGQRDMGEPCEYLDGKQCYYDGSTLNAERVFDILVAEGIDKMWEYLEGYYRSTFYGAREPGGGEMLDMVMRLVEDPGSADEPTTES